MPCVPPYIVYFDPHELHMTGHICYLKLCLKITTLYTRYFNIVTSFRKKFRRLDTARIKNRFNNPVMRVYDPKSEVKILFPN